MIWLAFALMTAAVVLWLVWPLAGAPAAAGEGRGADVAFYASQLDDLEADVGRGMVAAADASTTRTEIARRLLAAARQDTPAAGPVRSRRLRIVAIAAAAAAVPALALSLYLHLGHPTEPDLPLTARLDPQHLDVLAAIPRIEAHLADHPEDSRGFALLAPIYMRMGRYNDAARAYTAALRAGENAEQRAALGQALSMAADGVITADARAAFEQALHDDPALPQARFFLAVAAEQDNDKPKALALWRALLADTPPDAPWRAGVEQHLAALGGPQPPATASAIPSPNGAAGAAIAALAPDAQRQAIHGMVDGLAARLAQNGRDVDGWLRLIRAYTVLGEPERARAALADAHKGLDGDGPSLARIDTLGRELGLGS